MVCLILSLRRLRLNSPLLSIAPRLKLLPRIKWQNSLNLLSLDNRKLALLRQGFFQTNRSAGNWLSNMYANVALFRIKNIALLPELLRLLLFETWTKWWLMAFFAG